MSSVQRRVRQILSELPPDVTVVAAAKGASRQAVTEAIESGIRIVGHNRIPEARDTRPQTTQPVEWHYIGTLSRHAVRAASLRLFDMVQSVDSLALAQRIDAVCARSGMNIRVLLEVNSGREPQKAGVLPQHAEALVRELAGLEHLRLEGLMTIGPEDASPAIYRPCFAETFQLFQHLGRLAIPGIAMRHLSMGMSSSYRVAIEEGATMIRLGTALFGNR